MLGNSHRGRIERFRIQNERKAAKIARFMDSGPTQSEIDEGESNTYQDFELGSQERLSSFKKQQGRLLLKVDSSRSNASGIGDEYQKVGLSKLMSERKRETARLLAKQTKKTSDSWYKKRPTIAGEGNSRGGTIDRLCSPASFTGCYKREDRGGYVDPVRRETTDLLMNRSSRKGELSSKANAGNFRNEVEWRMSLQQRTEAGNWDDGGGVRYVGQMKSQYHFPVVRNDANGKKTPATVRYTGSLPSLG
jgi:hypothetical protein